MINIKHIIDQYVERADQGEDDNRDDVLTALILDELDVAGIPLQAYETELADTKRQVEEGIAARFMDHLFIGAALLAMHAY